MRLPHRLGPAALALLGAILMPPLQAQPQRVTVDLRNVATEVAGVLEVDLSQLPATVRMPLADAAQACAIAPETLAGQSGAPACTAIARSPGLERAVRRELARSAGPATQGTPGRPQGAFQPGTTQELGTPGGTVPRRPAAQQPEGRVSVDVSNVAAQLAAETAVAPAQVPRRVDLPVAAAAEACRVSADALSYQLAVGSASCTATVATPGVRRAVQAAARQAAQ